MNKIIKGWREANWQKPYVEEFSRPDKVELTLPMISLLPDDAVIKLKELFDGKVENLTQDELTALVTCYSEGGLIILNCNMLFRNTVLILQKC